LGEERANAIVRKALGALYRQYGERWWRTQGAGNVGERMASAFEMFAAGDALGYEVVKQAPDASKFGDPITRKPAGVSTSQRIRLNA
jgi:hypothetical protein